MNTTFRYLSRKVSFSCMLVSLLGFSSVSTMNGLSAPAIAQKMKGGLGSVFDKIQGIKGEKIVSQLEVQVRKLGGNIGTISSCMFKDTCTASQRAAFIGTSLLVLGLTAAAVGVTLTIAATSKEVDSVVATTSQEVKGWGSQAIFTRLTNAVNKFEQSLASLKTGIIKRELTAGQKKFMYGSALTIAALVTIVTTIAVGSYIYTKIPSEKELLIEKELQIPSEEKPDIVVRLRNTKQLGDEIKKPLPDYEIIKNLLEQGANPNALVGISKVPVLHRIIKNAPKDWQEIVKLLLNKGANIYAEGLSSLHVLVSRLQENEYDVQIADLLLKKGASIHSVDEDGRTPLHQVGNETMIFWLIDNEADVNKQDLKRMTPLALFAHRREKNLIKSLVKKVKEKKIELNTKMGFLEEEFANPILLKEGLLE